MAGTTWTEERKQAMSALFSTTPKCPICGDSDIDNFYKSSSGRRTNAYCITCHKQRCKERYHSKSLVEHRAAKAKMYGLSPEQYLDMLEKQQGKCAICKLEPTSKRGLAVDHDHETGEVRGLLCGGCNTALGSFKDDPEVLTSAIEYLRKG